MSTSDFQSSKLGTKEHWDTVYEKELANFKEIGDEGEIWFGEESVDKMVQWADEHVPPSDSPTILEIGSGNGTLLFALAEEGYASEYLSGIDYSQDAVKLAKSIAAKRGVEKISFNACDFLTEDPPVESKLERITDPVDHWDLLLDKGTYDAIALCPKDELGRSPVWNYPSRAARLIKPGGFFLITSCNFTEEELRTNFGTDTGLVYHSSIKYPTFTFGGQSGAKYSSVAFQKTDQ